MTYPIGPLSTARMRTRRLQLGLTQTELGRGVARWLREHDCSWSMSQPQVSHVERGLINIVQADLDAFGHVLQLDDPEWLLPGTYPQQKPTYLWYNDSRHPEYKGFIHSWDDEGYVWIGNNWHRHRVPSCNLVSSGGRLKSRVAPHAVAAGG